MMKGFDDFDLTTWAADGLTYRLVEAASDIFKTRILNGLKVMSAAASVTAAALTFLPPAVSASAIPVVQTESGVKDPAPAPAEVPPGYWADSMRHIRSLTPLEESSAVDPDPFF